MSSFLCQNFLCQNFLCQNFLCQIFYKIDLNYILNLFKI